MSISRRAFLQGIGTAGVIAGYPGFIGSVVAQSLSGIRPSFTTDFRLASSSLIGGGDLAGIRLRWNFPVFNPDGTFATCLPDRVIVHRRIVDLGGLFVPKYPNVGLLPIGLYPAFFWKSKKIVQISSHPAVFEFRDSGGNATSVEGINFGYRGNATVLKVIGSDGHCLMISTLKDGAQVYFDTADIVRFEFEGGARAQLDNPLCLDISGAGELKLNEPIAELEVRRPLFEKIPLSEGALRLNGLAGKGGTNTTLPAGQKFLDESEWSELITLSSEIAGPSCAGLPVLNDVDGIEVSKTDLFLTSAVSRWEMAPRLGFGFRDGQNPSTSKYDKILEPMLNLPYRDQVALYQVSAFWDSTGVQLLSNIASSRLDQPFEISKPRELRYLAQVSGKLDSDYIAIKPTATNSFSSPAVAPDADESVGQTTVSWAHVDHQRVAGILVSEQIKSPAGNLVQTNDWLQHRAVFNDGYRGNVRRSLIVDLDDTLTAEIRSFDGWDTISAEAQGISPRIALNFAPSAPKLACAAHIASPEEVEGQILIERLVTTIDFRPSCLPASPSDGSAPLEFAEWQPDSLLSKLLQKNFEFRLELLESIKRPKMIESKITEYARDGRGGFVKFDKPVDLVDFVGGFLDAENYRYHIRSFASDRLYIGRFESELNDEFDVDENCQLTSSATNIDEMDEPLLGRCRLSQDYDDEGFWTMVQTFEKIGIEPIDYTFLAQPLTRRPVDLPDAVDYRLRLIGERNTQIIVGEFSNIVSAQRLPMRPPPPRGLVVRQLGYDYYDRLLVCIELTPQDAPGNYHVQFALGRLETQEAFLAVAEPASLIGAQDVGQSLTMFESLPIGRNFQTDRTLTVGVSRVNAAGTFSPPATTVIVVPVE